MALRIISSAQITLSNVYDSFNIVASNENFSIACDDSGNPLAGEIGQNGKAITSISVYRGTTKLTPVNSNPSVNQFAINITNQINCQCAKKNNDKIYINSLSSGITGKVIINVNIEGTNTATKEITFFKTLNSLSDLIDGKFIFGLSNWSQNQNGIGDVGSNVKIIDSALSTYTSKLLEITNETWLYNKKAIDVQDDKIYEFKIRFKQSIDNTTGGKASYFGYTPYNSSGNAFGKDGSNNTYLIGGELLNTNSWKERTFYLSKTALPELNSGGKIIRPAVNAFPNGTVKFRPMFIVNYQNGNGIALVDYCTVTDVTDQFNIKELNYKTTTLEAKNGEINAAVENIKTFTQISNNPISLVAKVNYSSYDGPNDGEVYVHGLNSQKKSADIDGSCIWQDKKVVLPKQMFNPNGKVPEQEPIFMVRNIADNKWYSVWKENSTTWKRIVADVTANETISTFTPSDTNDIFIGYYITRKSNNQNPETPIDMAQIFSNGALDYRQANAMSFASSTSQLKIIQNEVSLKSSKDEMLMGVNKWKRTKYKKTLASSDTFPTFNDIANLKPTTQDEVNDSTNLVAGMEGDDYFILHFFTNVFVKSAKNISITGKGVDDTATFFTNGIEVGRMNDSETVTMNLKTGWNTIEILFYEHNGGESMNINTKISSLVDNMAYGIGGQSSAITLTPNQIDVLSKNINIRGKVTFDSLADTNVSGSIKDAISKDGNRTIIDGGHIKANSIEANSLQINSVVDKINQDGTKSINGNKVTINGQGISSVFSTKTEVNDKIDKLQIGGRNLWVVSDLINGHTATENPLGSIISAVDVHKIVKTLKEVNGNKYVTVQMWNPNKINNTSNANRIAFFDNSNKFITQYQTIKPNGVTYQSQIINVPSNAVYMRIGMICGGSSYDESIKIKVEFGNKPTDWTPAPEDTDKTIKDIETSFKQTKDSLEGRVSSTETSIRNIEKGSNQNLLYNADFAIMNGNLPDGWEVNPCVSFDKNNTTLDGMGSFWYDVTGQTEYHWYAAYSPMVQANKGQVFTASAYVLAYQNWQAVDDTVRIEIEYFNASGGRIGISGSSYNKSITAWQRLIVTGTCPDGTVKIRMIVHPTKNGRFNMSKPMLQVGEIATGWQRGFNAQDITTRLKTAESRITDSAIVNTVKNSNTFYTQDDINKKGYQTASQVQTTANGVLNKFTSSGGYNLIRNSTAACANTSAWTTTGTLGYSASDTMGTDSRYYMYLDNGTNKDERYAFSSRFKLKPNKKYTFSGYFHNYTKCPNFDVFVLSSAVNENTNDTSYTVVNQLISAGNTNGTWQHFSATFTTASNVQSGYIRIDNNGYNANGTGDNRVNWNCIQLIEGEIERPWSPHPSEVYDGITMIDRNGVTVTASNANTRTNMSASGFKITKINNGEDIFRADQQGLFLKGRFQIESVVNGINKDLLDNSLKGDINNAVSNSNNALNKINGLDVGGRNFALKTSNDYSSPYNGFNGNDNMCPSISKVITKGLKVGDQITIRLIYNYSNIVAVSGKTVSCWIQGAGDVGQWNSGTFPSQKYYPIGSGEIEMLYTATLNESHLKNNSWEVSIRHDGVQSGSVKWKEFKVERGNKATGWTPAPEDTYTKDQLQNEINNANSAINVSLKKIYTTGQIVDDKINNIKVGTKNLIRNSNFYKKNWDGWGFNNNPNNPATVEIIDDDRFTQCAKVTCKENFQGLYQGPDRTSGTKYSWSAWVKADSNCQLYVSHEQGDGSFYANIGTNWQRVEGSGVWRGNGGCLCFYAIGEMTYYLANVKYVEGDKIPIDWTPAPEDVDENISDTVSDAQETIILGYQNAINASAEQLSLTMSETYAKADDVSDQISSISSTLEQTASGLNATITSETKKVNDNLESYKETVSNYMRFDENGLSLGKTDSEFKTRLDNEKLSFQQNDEEVAYISNNKMNITDAEIKNKMILGSFEFIPRENGNLSLQWIRK